MTLLTKHAIWNSTDANKIRFELCDQCTFFNLLFELPSIFPWRMKEWFYEMVPITHKWLLKLKYFQIVDTYIYIYITVQSTNNFESKKSTKVRLWQIQEFNVHINIDLWSAPDSQTQPSLNNNDKQVTCTSI